MFGPKSTSSLFEIKNESGSKLTQSSSLFVNNQVTDLNNSQSKSIFGTQSSSNLLINNINDLNQSVDNTNKKSNQTSTAPITLSTGGLFGQLANNESKKNESVIETKTSSIFGNSSTKIPETKTENNLEGNKGFSLLGQTNPSNTQISCNSINANSNNAVSSNEEKQSLFSGINSNNNNPFIAPQTQNKNISVFSQPSSKPNENLNSFTKNTTDDLNTNTNKIPSNETTQPICAQNSQTQNKSLMHDKNPFLQKTSTNPVNNLFSS